MNISKKL